MKKIILAVFVSVLTCTSAFAFNGVDAGALNSMTGVGGGFQVHDMQTFKDMNFRYNEYNDYQDVQTAKENKQREFELTEPAMKRIYNQRPKENVQFVEKDGKIRIQSIQ